MNHLQEGVPLTRLYSGAGSFSHKVIDLQTPLAEHPVEVNMKSTKRIIAKAAFECAAWRAMWHRLVSP